MNGRIDVLDYLLQKSKNEINRLNNDGKTALMIASEYGYTMIVKILIGNGADSSLKSIEGKSALQYAQDWNHEEIIHLLK